MEKARYITGKTAQGDHVDIVVIDTLLATSAF